MSFYIDSTRNLHPKITSESKLYFDNLLDQGHTLTNASINILSELKPDKVLLFNGRLLETRVLFDTCKNLNVPIDVLEVHPSNNPNKSFKVVFENNLPHNIKYRHKVITEKWDNSPLDEDEKREIADSFFIKRREKKPAGDKVYTAHQEFGLLPKDWDNSKHNIAIFNSSEDEFAAVGGDFDKLALFESQIEGINFILDNFKENTDYHFYLRVHPNLSKIGYKYHTDLYKLSDRFPNVTVIPATDKIDTYALMDAAEKVIVFGSTMGVEAAYWQKPVILLGASLYYYADICHIPKTKEEIVPLIKSALEPKENLFIRKFGYYIMDFKRATFEEQMYQYFAYTTYTISIGGLKAHGVNYQKLLGSKKLFLFTVSAMRLILGKLYKDKYILPLEEE
ncbi:MAG: capsule biosynthesis protein [Bacteroidales bacterium]|nr:capsule biosynthesis protein [Bacteroidales bacterium]